MNLIPLTRGGPNELRLAGHHEVIALPQRMAATANDLVFGMRPEDVDIAQGAALPGQIDVPAIVEVVEPLGADTLVFTAMSGHPVAARVRPDVRPAPGAEVMLRLDLKRAHLFDAATGKAVGNTSH
jgi:ABC-type sugar transport system ATPase subunit